MDVGHRLLLAKRFVRDARFLEGSGGEKGSRHSWRWAAAYVLAWLLGGGDR
jgi:hypothetical protein